MSRIATKESSAAARLILLMNILHGLQPWLSSVAATRLLVSQVCYCPWIRRGGCAIKKILRSHKYLAQTGWLVQTTDYRQLNDFLDVARCRVCALRLSAPTYEE
jgi:hypothetical protein